jgi:hypothetical protein
VVHVDDPDGMMMSPPRRLEAPAEQAVQVSLLDLDLPPLSSAEEMACSTSTRSKSAGARRSQADEHEPLQVHDRGHRGGIHVSSP